MFDEAVVLNLLEVLMYHKDIVLALDSTLTEVAEYCVRKIASMLSTFKPEWPVRDIKKDAKMSSIEVFSPLYNL